MVGAFLIVNITSQASTIQEQGVDWSKYNGNSGTFGYSIDKFVFSQVGYHVPDSPTTNALRGWINWQTGTGSRLFFDTDSDQTYICFILIIDN